jgi:hypothetical protein
VPPSQAAKSARSSSTGMRSWTCRANAFAPITINVHETTPSPLAVSFYGGPTLEDKAQELRKFPRYEAQPRRD